MSLYQIFMVVGVIVVGGGWIAYFLWDRKMRKEEETQPKQRSERYTKTQTELSDWAKKMATHKSPAQQHKERKEREERERRERDEQA
jgi:Flp pilus assembly protein TadB